MRIIALHKREVAERWDAIKHHFEKVLARNSETATIEGLYKRAINGDYLILLAIENGEVEMAMVSEIITCDTGKKILLIPQLAGYDIDEWIADLVKELYLLADRLGCFQCLIAGARKGWIKKMEPFGGELASVAIEFDIEKNINNYR